MTTLMERPPELAGPRKQDPAAPRDNGLSLVVLRSFEELMPHVAAWEDLARSAADPNVFYEPWMFLPALRTLGEGGEFHIVAVLRGPGKRKDMCGFFPLVRRRGFKGLPLAVLGMWQHRYCFSCTPLVRSGCESEVLALLFDHLRRAPRTASLIEFPLLRADGPFQHALGTHLQTTDTLSHVSELYCRALIEPRADADGYILNALNNKRRTEYRRLEKRLGELGRLEHRRLEKEDDLDGWIADFLQLEGSGWKGEEGTALGSKEPDRAFFREIAAGAFTRGKLQMLGLYLDGKPLALKCNLVSGTGSFAFKIAYDEQYARYSPGVLLELANVRALHEDRSIHWMDSCAIAQHFMINRLWTERRLIQSLVVSTGRTPGDLVVSVLPMLRWFKRKLRSLFARQANKE